MENIQFLQIDDIVCHSNGAGVGIVQLHSQWEPAVNCEYAPFSIPLKKMNTSFFNTLYVTQNGAIKI